MLRVVISYAWYLLLSLVPSLNGVFLYFTISQSLLHGDSWQQMVLLTFFLQVVVEMLVTETCTIIVISCCFPLMAADEIRCAFDSLRSLVAKFNCENVFSILDSSDRSEFNSAPYLFFALSFRLALLHRQAT